MSEKSAAHENPLIPNARLKQMYRAILRAHLLGRALPPAQRALTAGREAALVSSALDLTARDLILDGFSTPVLDFLRGTPLRRTLAQSSNDRAPHPSSARVGSRNVRAEADSPSRIPAPSSPSARIHAALGAASALNSAALATKKNTEQSQNALDSAVVLFVSISGEVPADTWKSALAHAAQHDLPAIFLVLAASPRAAQTIDLRAIAYRARVPAMPVDADDPVALYRAAQESIGHARIGGGPALIECISFRANPRRSTVNTALTHLADYILSRSIASRAWMDREAAAFAAQIRRLKSASK